MGDNGLCNRCGPECNGVIEDHHITALDRVKIIDNPDRENCPSLTKLAPFILLLFAIGSSGYKNSLRSRSYVEIARAAPAVD